MRDAIVPLASFVAYTKRIRLATGILSIFYRSPALTAMTVATLDEISKGRMILGLGTGEQSWVEKQGIEFKKPLTAMKEYVTIVRRLLTGEPISCNGEIFRISHVGLGFTPKRHRVPIYIAARGPKMLQLAGEVADGVLNAEGLWTPEHIDWVRENVKLGAERGGRDPREVKIASYVLLAVSGDHDEAKEQAKRKVFSVLKAGLLDHQLERMRLHSPDMAKLFEEWRWRNVGGVSSQVPNELVSKIAIYGTREDCARKMRLFRGSGVSLPIIIPVGEDLDKTLKMAAHL